MGVAGTEASLWWGLLGIVGAGLGLWGRRLGAQIPGAIGMLCGAFAVVVSLIPLLESLPVATQNGVTLSISRFFLGEGQSPTAAPETVTYSDVGAQGLQMDVYRAAETATAQLVPAIVVVHGGSWNAGNKSDFAHWNHWLSRQGFTVFDIQYRLAPQPNWREATGDVKTAVAWVKRHAAHYNVDPHRLALLGRSAGGHLALLAAYTPNDPALPPGDHSDANTRVRAVISLYGPTDLTWGYNNPAHPDVVNGPRTLRRFLGGDPASLPDIYTEASPISHVGAQTPPTLLFHGERDLLVGPQHARRLSAKLTAAHAAFQAVYIPYALHGFDFDINGWGSQIEQPVLLAFLRRYTASRQGQK